MPDLPSPTFYVVAIWNAEHNSRKIWMNCTTQANADKEVKKLRRWGLDAETYVVGVEQHAR